MPERMLLPAYRREPTHGLNADYSDLSDTLLFDNEETVADFLIAIDRIEDKMAFALKKTGWNPRLRMLAHAMMEMRKRLVLEINHDGVFVRIPASVYSAITPAIADAIMDTDMKMIVPIADIGSQVLNRHIKRTGKHVFQAEITVTRFLI